MFSLLSVKNPAIPFVTVQLWKQGGGEPQLAGARTRVKHHYKRIRVPFDQNPWRDCCFGNPLSLIAFCLQADDSSPGNGRPRRSSSGTCAILRALSVPAPTHINDYLNASDKEKIPYELLPAISVKESTCGKHYLGNNVWGWGSARIHFESVRAGIDYVSHQLAAGSPYAGLSTFAKLQAYGPHDRFDPKTGKWLPSLTYAPSVISFINQIDSYEQQYQNRPPARP